MDQIFSVIFRCSLLILLVWIFFQISRFLLLVKSKRENDLDLQPVSPEEIESSIKKYGTNTNSVVHLYGSLDYYRPSPQVAQGAESMLVGYTSLLKKNVMITDPLCPKELGKEVIIDFARFTQHQEKDCLLFPISEATARQAAESGFGIIQVGKEPIFDLLKYEPSQHQSKILSAVAQAKKKGIIFEECRLADLPRWADQFDAVLKGWFLSRRSEKMQLISEVSPFKYAKGKKYFIARNEDQIEAFLACSPVYGRDGFFIHDMIRKPTAMNGVGEGLIVTALTALKVQNYKFASLGIASLAGLDEPGVNKNYRLLNRFLMGIFNRSDTFIKFKNLYHFKKKFGPTLEEPAYLAFYPAQLKVSHIVAVSGMFSSRGLIGDILFKFRRLKDGTQLPHPLKSLLSPEIATLARPMPFTFSEFLARLKFTCFIFFLNVYTYLNSTSQKGDIKPEYLMQYGFNYKNFLQYKWFILVKSNFLHFNFLHLFSNMVMLFIFCGLLEFVGGSFIAAVVYLISMNANVPTGFFILPILKACNIDLWKETMEYIDVGASLGIMGCAGALLQFLKYRRRLLLIGVVVTILLAVVQRFYFGVDHTFAILLGYLIGHACLHWGYPKTNCKKLFISSKDPSSYNSPIPFRSRPR